MKPTYTDKNGQSHNYSDERNDNILKLFWTYATHVLIAYMLSECCLEMMNVQNLIGKVDIIYAISYIIEINSWYYMLLECHLSPHRMWYNNIIRIVECIKCNVTVVTGLM